jgi:signal transduction histidine kinase
MSISWNSNLQAQYAILQAFAVLTKCAIGLFEPSVDGEVKEILPLEGFEPYCEKIRSFEQGDHLCHQDHINRAKQVIESGVGGLKLCHAGVLNEALPIVVDGKVRAVLMYGQMWVKGDERCAKARDSHEDIIAFLKPTQTDEQELRFYYNEIKHFTQKEFDTLNEQLSFLQRLFYEKLHEEQERSKQTERIIHELQTRLQPVLAQAELIRYDLLRIKTGCSQVECLLPIANELLGNALAMRALVHNLGDFLPEYQFKELWLRDVVEEAVTLYKAEADRKDVNIVMQLEWPSKIEMSRRHLRQAINNLLHNAIKYSFRGSPNRYRYVNIEGEINGSDYVLIFSNYGIGILPQEMDSIFEPGYQGELTRGEHRSGAGQGLTVVKDIVEKHHGTIKVQSVHKGDEAYVNRFVVRLPLVQPVGGERNENCLD